MSVRGKSVVVFSVAFVFVLGAALMVTHAVINNTEKDLNPYGDVILDWRKFCANMISDPDPKARGGYAGMLRSAMIQPASKLEREEARMCLELADAWLKHEK